MQRVDVSGDRAHAHHRAAQTERRVHAEPDAEQSGSEAPAGPQPATRNRSRPLLAIHLIGRTAAVQIGQHILAVAE